VIIVDDLLRYDCIPITRGCPACRVWNRCDTRPLLHTARIAYQATCPNCGHTWPCRITGADRMALRREMSQPILTADYVVPRLRGLSEAPEMTWFARVARNMTSHPAYLFYGINGISVYENQLIIRPRRPSKGWRRHERRRKATARKFP
jgi:hypothetical protein